MEMRNENTGEVQLKEQEAATGLIALVAAGNTEAYQALRELYWKRVCAVVCTVSDAGASDKLIEDIADYAFDTMRNRVTTYDSSKGDFWPWLRGIAKNAPKNVLRSHKSRREREKKWTYVHQLPDTGSMTIHVRPDGGSIAVHDGEEWEPERRNKRRVLDVNRWIKIKGPSWLGEIDWMFRVHAGSGGITFEMVKENKKK
jgi:DNA-directed RNA polymerase specialized sigma24 family protein